MMKLLIIDGNNHEKELEQYASTFKQKLTQKEIEITHYILHTLEINQCTGCNDCIYKTPGICSITDGMQQIMKDFINVDRVIIISSIKRGFINALTKKVLDRLLPLELPYVDVKDGLFSHKLRYDTYPKIGFILQPEALTDEDDLDVMHRINDFIGDFYGGFLYQKTTEDSMEEIIDETLTI